MRIAMRAVAPAMFGIIGMFALHTAALASGADPVTGDLSIEDGGAAFAFCLNAGFALLFLIVAMRVANQRAHRAAGSNRPASPKAAPATQVTQGFG